MYGQGYTSGSASVAPQGMLGSTSPSISGGGNNPGLGIPGHGHTGSPSILSPPTSALPVQQRRPSTLQAVASSAPSGSGSSYTIPTLRQQQHQQFNRTNSSGSALSISTSPTTTGTMGSPMTPSSPAYNVGTGATSGAGPSYAMESSPAMRGSTSPSFRSPHPSGSQQQQYAPPQVNFNPATPSTTSHPTSHSVYHTPSGSSDGSSQYATYLDDPMLHQDRRTNSYSPSHYTLAAAQNAHQQQANAGGYSYPSTSTLPPPQSPRNQQTQQKPQHSPVQPTQQHQRQISQLSPGYGRPSPSLQQHPSIQAYPGSPVSPSTAGLSPSSQKQHLVSSPKPSGVYQQSSQQQPQQTFVPKQRPRSTGSAFRRVRDQKDLHPNTKAVPKDRRAHPEGGTVSVSILLSFLECWY